MELKNVSDEAQTAHCWWILSPKTRLRNFAVSYSYLGFVKTIWGIFFKTTELPLNLSLQKLGQLQIGHTIPIIILREETVDTVSLKKYTHHISRISLMAHLNKMIQLVQQLLTCRVDLQQCKRDIFTDQQCARAWYNCRNTLLICKGSGHLVK